MIERILAWIDCEGTTRVVAIQRILLALTVWSRYGAEMRVFSDFRPERLAVAAVFWVLSSAMLVGFLSRTSTTLLGVLLMTLGLGELAWVDEGWTHHHTHFLSMAVLVLGFAPCGRSFSLDRALWGREERGWLWAGRLLGVLVCTLYFWSAIDKFRPAFLAGDRLEQITVWLIGAYPEGAAWHGVAVFLAVSTVGLEFWLTLALWHPRVQWLAFAIGIALHAGFYVLLPVNTFSVTMMTLYLSFLAPSVVDRGLERLAGLSPPPERAS